MTRNVIRYLVDVADDVFLVQFIAAQVVSRLDETGEIMGAGQLDQSARFQRSVRGADHQNVLQKYLSVQKGVDHSTPATLKHEKGTPHEAPEQVIGGILTE